MNYDNKSRKELIEILNTRNEKLEEITASYEDISKKLKQLEESNIFQLAEDLKKQRQTQAELISQLRTARAEVLDTINTLTATIKKYTK